MADQVMAMGQSFTPVPEGEYQAVCVDVVDLGMQHNEKWNKLQHKVAIVFQLDDAETPGGKLYEVAERFTVSMSEKARLRTFLEQWRGRPYKPEQLTEGVPLHKLDGQNAIVVITHNRSGEKVYANIFSIRPIGKGDQVMKAHGYARSPHWAEKVKQVADTDPETGQPVGVAADDEEIPF